MNKQFIDDIYLSRNRFKRRYQLFTYEALRNIGEKLAEDFLGKKSFSLFSFASNAVVLGMLDYKLEIFTDEDKRIIRELRSRITYNR